ncbi:MAG: gamma carbonic anhydrase family protein [Verrucomicrobia bacterium]|nr:gamma carbonic anhydrase family protein [Verrucomicrobiota bacterium]
MEPRPRSYACLDRSVRVPASAFVAASADLLGEVSLGENSSVWYQCVLRGDINSIRIGANTNLQDGTIVHVADRFGTVVGDWVTVGHRALLHACTVGDEVLVGMGAIIMDGAVIGSRSIVGAGAVVTGGTVVPPGSLVLGAPGKVVRTLGETEQAEIRNWALRYVATVSEYLKRGLK